MMPAMKKLPHLLGLGCLALALSGCALIDAATNASARQEAPALFDLGPVRTVQGGDAGAALPPLSVAEVMTPAWLDGPMIYYRLAYANDQQPRPYANSRWSMPPARLFNQRLKSRLAQAGGVVLSAGDGASNTPVLRIEADDFTQTFQSAGQSSGQVAMRASVFNGRTLLAQKTFIREASAPSADAAGGVRALASAGDAVIADMMVWLGTLPLKK